MPMKKGHIPLPSVMIAAMVPFLPLAAMPNILSRRATPLLVRPIVRVALMGVPNLHLGQVVRPVLVVETPRKLVLESSPLQHKRSSALFLGIESIKEAPGADIYMPRVNKSLASSSVLKRKPACPPKPTSPPPRPHTYPVASKRRCPFEDKTALPHYTST